MTTPSPGITGPLTPYVVPGDALDWLADGRGLLRRSRWVSTVTTGQKTAALYNMCQSATQQVDEHCNQPLRATLSTEEQSGPDYYLTVQVGSGMGRMILQRWPVTQIVAVNVAAAAGFPTQWTAVPAGYWRHRAAPDGPVRHQRAERGRRRRPGRAHRPELRELAERPERAAGPGPVPARLAPRRPDHGRAPRAPRRSWWTTAPAGDPPASTSGANSSHRGDRASSTTAPARKPSPAPRRPRQRAREP